MIGCGVDISHKALLADILKTPLLAGTQSTPLFRSWFYVVAFWGVFLIAYGFNELISLLANVDPEWQDKDVWTL